MLNLVRVSFYSLRYPTLDDKSAGIKLDPLYVKHTIPLCLAQTYLFLSVLRNLSDVRLHGVHVQVRLHPRRVQGRREGGGWQTGHRWPCHHHLQ